MKNRLRTLLRLVGLAFLVYYTAHFALGQDGPSPAETMAEFLEAYEAAPERFPFRPPDYETETGHYRVYTGDGHMLYAGGDKEIYELLLTVGRAVPVLAGEARGARPEPKRPWWRR